jgi:hypothetical protein
MVTLIRRVGLAWRGERDWAAATMPPTVAAWCGSWCEMNRNYASRRAWCDATRTVVAGSRPTRGCNSSS